MHPAAAALVVRMCGYTGGVAAVRFYQYPAVEFGNYDAYLV